MIVKKELQLLSGSLLQLFLSLLLLLLTMSLSLHANTMFIDQSATKIGRIPNRTQKQSTDDEISSAWDVSLALALADDLIQRVSGDKET